MKFSQRKGITSVARILQVDVMSVELRNSLWNVVFQTMEQSPGFIHQRHADLGSVPKIRDLAKYLWMNHFKRAVDDIPLDASKLVLAIRAPFHNDEWYEVYDLIESIVAYFQSPLLESRINEVLERELSGYRIVSGSIAEVTNSNEIQEIEVAISTHDSASIHLETALRLLSDKASPDFRNSIKESISAVEAAAKAMAQSEKATLGDALRLLEKKRALHPALREGFSKLYGYTNDADGIRHSMMEATSLTMTDARFFLVTCSAFVNYLRHSLSC